LIQDFDSNKGKLKFLNTNSSNKIGNLFKIYDGDYIDNWYLVTVWKEYSYIKSIENKVFDFNAKTANFSNFNVEYFHGRMFERDPSHDITSTNSSLIIQWKETDGKISSMDGTLRILNENFNLNIKFIDLDTVDDLVKQYFN
jgi:hypothetical protein